jgi:hypothetical protein
LLLGGNRSAEKGVFSNRRWASVHSAFWITLCPFCGLELLFLGRNASMSGFRAAEFSK